MKKLNFCVITKPGHNRGTKKKVEKFLESKGCRLLKTPKGADFCLVIGGDGTLLHHQAGIEAPILGIRTPTHLGHYLKANHRDFESGIRKLLNGEGYFIHKLPRLEALVNGKRVNGLALNEVLVSPIYTRRMLDAEVSLRGRVSKESNSGIVIHTPSGSNAFAKSLGVRKERFGIMPIAPFSGRLKRDCSFGKSVSVRILVKEAELCIDGQEGQAWRLRRGDRVLIRKAKTPALLVGFERKF